MNVAQNRYLFSSFDTLLFYYIEEVIIQRGRTDKASPKGQKIF